MRQRSVFSNFEKMKEAIEKTSSIKEAMKYLGREPVGGNYKHFRDWATKHGLSIKRGPRSTPGDLKRKHTNDEMFSTNSVCSRHAVRSRIVSDGLLPYICSLCGNTGEHNGKPLSLHLDHVNGIRSDHRLENMRFLCPNCHSQTPTYGGKRPAKEKNLDYRRKDYPERRKVQWPTKEELKSLLSSNSYVSVGKMYGVSDNAVRRWAKKYELL